MKIALITFPVLTAISIAVLFSLPKTYLAVTRIQVESQPSVPGQPQQSFDPYFIQSEFEKIKSQAVLTRAIRELRQNPLLPDFGKTRRAPMDDPAMSRELLKKLDLRQSRSTTLIEIRFADRNATTAAIIANTIARSYVAEAKARAMTDVKIIDLAQAPNRPISPNVPKLLAIATVLNTLLAVFAGFFASNLFR
ncbi:MAG: Wzz/FepE/Etk N-terminal domain-containing protein [Limisphaerales bacterium]